MPPVTITSWSPARIIWSAISTARIDDAQTLLIVSAPTSIGIPAPTAACRAGARLGLEPRAPRAGPDDDRAELGRALVGEGAAKLPERRADCRDDDGTSH